MQLVRPHLLSHQQRKDLPTWQARATDWRNGAIVYQIFVDRFAVAPQPPKKKPPFRAPRRLLGWDKLPTRGRFLTEHRVWSHELEFWGGDLNGLISKLPYLEDLGVEVIYLNPIFKAFSNHKYDTCDYLTVDPAYGTRADLKRLTELLHSKGMRIILDGVFNHVGCQNPLALGKTGKSKGREIDFLKRSTVNGNGYVAWRDVDNLPELDWEKPAVRDYLYATRNSVVQQYLQKEKIDGWRLDVADDIAWPYLAELTQAAHHVKPDSLIVGEIWTYPEEWFPALDGVLNMHGRELVLHMIKGNLNPVLFGQMWERMCDDAGIDNILKSWLVLDNHDTRRLASVLTWKWQVQMARALQFTLPGSVCLYYGSEVGMIGGDDPEMRAPMLWEYALRGNELLTFHKQLIAMRKANPALRYGDFRVLPASSLAGFMRRTLRPEETIIVIANPSQHEVQDILQIRDSKLPNHHPLHDLLGGPSRRNESGTLPVKLPPHTIQILRPDPTPMKNGYDRFSRYP